MAIIRSRGNVDSAVQLSNPQVLQALRDWEEKIQAAREEGIAEGLQRAAEQVEEAKAIQQSVDEKIQAVEQAADLRIKQKEEQYKTELGSVVSSLQEALDEVAVLEQQAVASAEHAALKIGCALAAHILQKDIEENNEWMIPIIHQAMEQIPDKRDITMRLHPEDAEHVEASLQVVLNETQQATHVTVTPDTQISRGSLIIESDGAFINAGISHNWDRLQEQLRSSAPSVDWHASAVAGPESSEADSPALQSDQEDAVADSATDSETDQGDEHAES